MTQPRVTTRGLVSAAQETATTDQIQWAVGAGSANVITAAYSPALTELTDGLAVSVRLPLTNTTTTPTFNPDGLGAHTIVKNGGVLDPGDLPVEAFLRYKLATTTWELTNPRPRLREPGPLWGIAGGTVDVITLTLTPQLGALGAAQDGFVFGFRATGANVTATPTLAVSGLTAYTIKKLGAQALVAGDIPRASFEARVMYHYDASTPWFELVNPVNVTSVSGDTSKYHAVDAAGSDTSTAQPFFPTAGAATLAVGTYRFFLEAHISRAAGTNAHTTGFTIGGTATLGWVHGVIKTNLGETAALVAANMIPFSVATETVFKASSTTASEQIIVEIEGTINVTVAGTVIFNFKYNSAPGGAPTIKQGARLFFFPITANPQGTWV